VGGTRCYEAAVACQSNRSDACQIGLAWKKPDRGCRKWVAMKRRQERAYEVQP